MHHLREILLKNYLQHSYTLIYVAITIKLETPMALSQINMYNRYICASFTNTSEYTSFNHFCSENPAFLPSLRLSNSITSINKSINNSVDMLLLSNNVGSIFDLIMIVDNNPCKFRFNVQRLPNHAMVKSSCGYEATFRGNNKRR